MRKNSAILILIFLLPILLAVPCAASENITKINDLIEQSIALDNTEVTVQGELIGEALERGDYTWININDTTNAIGIWVKKSDIDQIQFYGDYKHKGDLVKIAGVFHKACSEHGGDVDIHCTDIKIIETGHNIHEQISTYKVVLTVSLILIAAFIVIIYLKVKKKSDLKPC
jgi:hypothetical protein